MSINLKKILWPIVYRWRKYSYPLKVKGYEREIFKKYNSTDLKSVFPRIIFMLDENFAQGGFVDRLKGLITAYYLSSKYGKKFALFVKDSKDPFLSLINSHEVQIITNPDLLNFNRRNSCPVVWYNYMPTSENTIKHKLNYKSEIHLYCNMNMIPVLLTNKRESNILWSDIFRKVILFPFQNDILSSESLINNIGIHLRFIGLLGDFSDLRSHSADEENKKNMLTWCEDKLIEIIKKHPGATFRIVTDSILFLNGLSGSLRLKDYFHLMSYSSDYIGHTALDKNPLIFQKAIYDFRLLSNCNHVYQLRFGKMHKSDFSRYAAMSSNAQFSLIEE